jgi:hypothetical protein
VLKVTILPRSPRSIQEQTARMADCIFVAATGTPSMRNRVTSELSILDWHLIAGDAVVSKVLSSTNVRKKMNQKLHFAV